MRIEYYKYTDLKCEECGGTIVYDEHRAEYYCIKCGLVHHDHTQIESRHIIYCKSDYNPAPKEDWQEPNEFIRKII